MEDADSANDNDDEDSRLVGADAVGADATTALMSGKVDKISLSSETDKSQPSRDELGSHSDSYNDSELDNVESDDDDVAYRMAGMASTFSFSWLL